MSSEGPYCVESMPPIEDGYNPRHQVVGPGLPPAGLGDSFVQRGAATLAKDIANAAYLAGRASVTPSPAKAEGRAEGLREADEWAGLAYHDALGEVIAEIKAWERSLDWQKETEEATALHRERHMAAVDALQNVQARLSPLAYDHEESRQARDTRRKQAILKRYTASPAQSPAKEPTPEEVRALARWMYCEANPLAAALPGDSCFLPGWKGNCERMARAVLKRRGARSSRGTKPGGVLAALAPGLPGD